MQDFKVDFLTKNCKQIYQRKKHVILGISHYFFVRKNPEGLGDYPQQAGEDTTLVASKANA